MSSQRELSEQQRQGSVNRESFRTELDLFVSDSIISRASCPLKWWNENHARFPVLAAVAREYLTIPATSVLSERLFSKAGEIITKKRSSINPNKADKTIFLMENL